MSVVACSRSVVDALEAAKDLASEGIDVEVVDIRSLAPIDVDTIVASVRKTGRLVAADESYEICGVASELIATVSIHAWSALKAAPIRAGAQLLKGLAWEIGAHPEHDGCAVNVRQPREFRQVEADIGLRDRAAEKSRRPCPDREPSGSAML